MRYNQQQIHRELNRASQQEDVAHIKWLLAKNGLAASLKKEIDICEWAEDFKIKPKKGKPKLMSIFQNVDRYESAGKNDSAFDNFRETSLNHSESNPSPKCVFPKRVTLRLKLPCNLEKTLYDDKSPSERLLPVLPKRILLPFNFLRSLQKRKSLEQLQAQSKEPQELFWPQLEDRRTKKGRLVGLTRRIKAHESPRSPPSPTQKIDLRSCMYRQALDRLQSSFGLTKKNAM